MELSLPKEVRHRCRVGSASLWTGNTVTCTKDAVEESL